MSSLATYVIFVINLVLNLLLVYLTINYLFKKDTKEFSFPFKKDISSFNYWLFVCVIILYTFFTKFIIEKFWWLNYIIYILIFFITLSSNGIYRSSLFENLSGRKDYQTPKYCKKILSIIIPIVAVLELFIIIFFTIFPFLF
jgi:hypothetical protein